MRRLCGGPIRGGSNLQLLRVFGLNPLVGYVLHGMIANAVRPFAPKDSPLLWVVFTFAVVFRNSMAVSLGARPTANLHPALGPVNCVLRRLGTIEVNRKWLLCFLAFLAMKATAQEFRATLSGDVVDTAGAAVEGARVLATSVERNVPYSATTNASGRYVIQFLLPGNVCVDRGEGQDSRSTFAQIFPCWRAINGRWTFDWNSAR